MKRIIMLGTVLVMILVSLGGCCFVPGYDRGEGRGGDEGHDRGGGQDRSGGHEERR
jgi:hypothetical protein